MKCPNCGSTAQVRCLTTNYQEVDAQIGAIRYCVCGCGETFIYTELFKFTGESMTASVPRSRIQQMLYGKGC